MTDISLLPPNATPLERAIAASGARVSNVPVPLASLWRPDTCPSELLPWLAWALSIDQWETAWSDAQKRAEIARSIALHRVKGTRAAVDAVIDRFDQLVEIVEWWERRPPGPAHTFDLMQTINDYDGAPLSAAFVEKIAREVAKAKPARSHMTVVQRLLVAADIRLTAAARVAGFIRLGGTAASDPDPVWLTYLQTEDGEPLQLETGAFLENVL